MPESLVVSVNFPLVVLISLIESLKLPAEILLLPLQPGVVRGEGGEDQLSPGHLITVCSTLGPGLLKVPKGPFGTKTPY